MELQHDPSAILAFLAGQECASPLSSRFGRHWPISSRA
jgi:hypothetical protein